MLNVEQLHAIMPRLPAAQGAALLPFLESAIREFAINRPARAAAFLAQLAHESAEFRFMEEIWGPTPAQRRYEPPDRLAADLGNTEPGDGLRFKGRGPIQITGRANYRRFGELLGLDLIADPARAAAPEVAFRIAGVFWSKKGLNELADRATGAAFREITRRINGGFNGLVKRQRYYAVARAVLGVVGPVVAGEAPAAPPGQAAEEPPLDRGWEARRAEARRRARRRTARLRTAGTRSRRSMPKRRKEKRRKSG